MNGNVDELDCQFRRIAAIGQAVSYMPNKRCIMPGREYIAIVANNLKRRIEGKSFERVSLYDITNLLREASEEEGFKLEESASDDLERALKEQGMGMFPHLRDADTGGAVRIFRTGTVVAALVDMLTCPSTSTDKHLTEITEKFKFTIANQGYETEPIGRPVDDEFIKHIDNARKIYLESTGGQKLTDSVEILREMREERDEHLQRVIWGDEE